MNKKYINRPYYTEKVRPFMDKSIIKVITGQRRVGKSHLLYQLMDIIREKNKDANIIYINKEEFEFDFIKTYKDLVVFAEGKLRKDTKNYLFIDEVQDIEEFERALRHFQSKEEFDVYCTGSNANMLSGDLATYLSGRYIEIKVFSLSFLEFLNFHKLDNTNDSLKKYMLWGGLPFIRNLPQNDDIISEYISNIYRTIIYKDIISKHNVRNSYFLENLVRYLANNAGNIISANKISNFLKSNNLSVSPQIVMTYLSHLINAFLIYKVNRIDITGKKIFEINGKYYFEDWGIRNAIVGKDNFSINQVIENVIYIHLITNGYDVKVGIYKNLEIDFVAEKAGKKLYIQAAYLLPDKKVREREFGNLLKIKDNYKKIVVSLDEYQLGDFKGIENIHLKEFLLTID